MRKFIDYATSNSVEDNIFTQRVGPVEVRKQDYRTEFERDYTRILHSTAYRRLKHKTQVFFDVRNDHVCTRMEHVAHVESVSTTIAKNLGLNVALTKAIAMGHDLGHAPFGHKGEEVISNLTQKYLHKKFWHEQNGLYFVDNIELLSDSAGVLCNLNLTNGVRDGIISHCGEDTEDTIKPRAEFGDLSLITEKGFSPATWEACVVKISDTIAYLGRDIEDAKELGFLNSAQLNELRDISEGRDNTTAIIHDLILDICENSSVEKGICFSPAKNAVMRRIKSFNYRNIYANDVLKTYKSYTELVLTSIFNALMRCYDGNIKALDWQKMTLYSEHYYYLMKEFTKWLAIYCDKDFIFREKYFAGLMDVVNKTRNKKIYGSLASEDVYVKAVIEFMSGMTDRFAIECFNEILEFEI